MYVDLWGWFWEEEVRAYRQDDDTVKQIIRLAREGWAHRRNAESALMLGCFESAASIAQEHQNPCWELFCTYWACSTLFYHVDDLDTALQRTIQLIARAHQPQIEHCPIRSRIYFLLADIYYELDVFGYEDQIRESLDFLENDIAMDEDTHFRLQHRLADLAFLHEDYDDAFERVTRYMADAQENEFRMRSAHQLLRAIAYARGDIQTAYHHSQHAGIFARNIQSHVDVAVSLLWQAALLRRQDENGLATAKYLQGMLLFTSHDLPRWPDYFNALCDYLEMTGDGDGACQQRLQQIEEYEAYGSVFYLSVAHLQYCRLLGRLGLDMQSALHDARELTSDMLKPGVYQEKLDRIASGNYYEYDWQRDRTMQ